MTTSVVWLQTALDALILAVLLQVGTCSGVSETLIVLKTLLIDHLIFEFGGQSEMLLIFKCSLHCHKINQFIFQLFWSKNFRDFIFMVCFNFYKEIRLEDLTHYYYYYCYFNNNNNNNMEGAYITFLH